MNWDWAVLVNARFVDGRVAVDIGPLPWAIGLLLAAGWVVGQRPWRLLGHGWEVQEISPTFFGVQWKITRNARTAQLAHEAYVELVTRKAGIPIEQDHDVIVEIYNSWYSLFGEIRRLGRGLPAEALARDPNLRRLHDLLIDVLNKGLRPHLTRWQSRFRYWYADARRNSPNEGPQEIQRRFPEYDQLVAGLRDANATLMALTAELRGLAHGTQR